MTKMMRTILAAVMISSPFALVSMATTVAHAQDAAGRCDDCGPVQDGSNSGRNNQSGSSNSGDAVGGQVTGVVSSGAASVDARNTTTDSTATSGDAEGTNSQLTFTGLANLDDDSSVFSADDAAGRCDDCGPIQDGNNRTSATQTVNASTGDAVTGQVTGVVTAAGGSASVVVANRTERSDALTGDAEANNTQEVFTGLVRADDDSSVFDLDDANGRCDDCGPIQDGNNSTRANQTANASSGDAVAGQVNGVVAGGRTSLDANNVTVDSSATSGDAEANNSQTAFTGLAWLDDDSEVFNFDDAAGRCDDCGPIQDGNNNQGLSQSANASSGDAIAGQVSGVVTSAGGSASVVVANTTTRTDSFSGETTFDNSEVGFVGLGQLDDDSEVFDDI